MSYNGSGTFQINTTGQPVVTGTVISSTAFNALTADLATGLSTAITKDGQTATTARIPFAAGINSSSATDSTSTSTGSIITSGGVGIAKALYVGTTANITGTTNLAGLTASSAVATDASKNLVSVTNTGTGNNVLATSPTITTPTISSLSSAAATALTLQSAGTTAITVDTSQNVGIGTTSPRNFEVARSDANTSFGAAAAQYPVNIRNTDTTANNWASIGFNQGASSLVNPVSIGAQFASTTAASFVVATSGAERMRIDSSGNLLVGATVTSNGGKFLVSQPTAASQSAVFLSTNATAGNNYGILVAYTAASPNGISNSFVYCSDNTQLRAEFRSNGGLANFSANNANLSDARTKTDIQDAGSYLAKICAIPVRTFKYKDQTDDLLNLGCIAQEVETVAPELVDVSGFGKTPDDGVPLKAIYQTDLQYALMKCIQELKSIIDTQAERIAVLEAK